MLRSARYPASQRRENGGRKRMTFAARLAALTFLAALLPVAAQSQAPDTVLVNGKIVTLDSRSTIAQAIAVRDGKISAVGPTGEIRALAGPATRMGDLAGRTVIPG